MPLNVATPVAQNLLISDGFGASATVRLMGGTALSVAILLEDQAAISVLTSDGGRVSVVPGFGLSAGQGVGVAAGAANVNAVGASIAAAAGTSAGLSTVAAVSGAAGATEAAGTADGLAAASGVGASVAASAGASAGAATATAVGSSGAATEAAGTAAGVAAAAAVGGLTIAAAGSAGGVATASAGGASRVASLGISDGVANVSGVGEAVTAGGFDPASLFGASEAGFFFDFTTANCYTDTTRTTNATLSDTVAGVTDLSGNGNHASMSTTGSRPAMDETSGLQHVTFDGIDDRLEATVNMTGVTAATLWAVISKDGDVDDGRVVGNSLSVGRFQLKAPNTSADLRYRLEATRTDNGFGREAFSASTYAAPDLAYLVGWHIGDNSTNPCSVLRRNGSQVGTNANTSVWSGLGSTVYRIGNQEFGNEDFQGKIYAVGLIGRVLTSGELSDLEAWCATRGGI